MKESNSVTFFENDCVFEAMTRGLYTTPNALKIMLWLLPPKLKEVWLCNGLIKGAIKVTVEWDDGVKDNP